MDFPLNPFIGERYSDKGRRKDTVTSVGDKIAVACSEKLRGRIRINDEREISITFLITGM